MRRPIRAAVLFAACGFALPLAPGTIIAAVPTTSTSAPISWTARDTRGSDVAVPSRGAAVTVVAFLRPGQAQSDDALKQITDAASNLPAGSVGVVVVLSGPDNAAAAGKVVAPEASIVTDADYALSGKMNIHVWPATVVVASDGTEMARLSGMPSTFAADLSAHVDYAARRIDRSGLDERLATRKVIAATTQQAATRYLIIANALMERGQFDAALAEIDRGLERDAGEASLRLARVRVLLRLKQFDAALTAAGQLGDAAPGWQAGEVRGEALIALGRWPEAKLAVADAVELNPHPGHAFYLSGLIATQEQDWKAAAEAFRKAYEAKSSAKAHQ